MWTYKMHALGDYARCICLFGASNGYSTQTVCSSSTSSSKSVHIVFSSHQQGKLEHRRCKRFYPRVHKGKRHYKCGIAKHVHHEHAIHNVGRELNLDMSRPAKRRKVSDRRTGITHEGLPQAPPQQRYQLPERSQNIFMLDVFLRENRQVPAVKVHISLYMPSLNISSLYTRTSSHICGIICLHTSYNMNMTAMTVPFLMHNELRFSSADASSINTKFFA